MSVLNFLGRNLGRNNKKAFENMFKEQEPRYIEADSLIHNMRKRFIDDDDLCVGEYWSAKEVLKVIENEPTVATVTHAYWINVSYPGECELWECSHCHERSCCKGKYCNECGAKMDAINVPFALKEIRYDGSRVC